jgi:hypothetical protein
MRDAISYAPPSTPTQRLDRLEREARWWRVLGLMSAALLGVLLLLGAAPPGAPVQDEIRARIVTLVDAAGHTRAAPALEFHDSDGRKRAMLAVSTDGQPVFGLTDQNGTPRVGMTVLPSGRPQIMP